MEIGMEDVMTRLSLRCRIVEPPSGGTVTAVAKFKKVVKGDELVVHFTEEELAFLPAKAGKEFLWNIESSEKGAAYSLSPIE